MATEGKGRDAAPTRDRVIAKLIIDDIVEGRLAPGAWLREREMAERFGGSHILVREALRHVVYTGLATVEPFRGTFVVTRDHYTIAEISELWKSALGSVCRLACKEMSERDGRQLTHFLVEYKDVAQRSHDPFERLKVSMRMSRFIAKRSKAPFALELLDRLALIARWQYNIHRDVYVESYDPCIGPQTATLYEELWRAIVARDANAAEALARRIIAMTRDNFERALANADAAASAPTRLTAETGSEN